MKNCKKKLHEILKKTQDSLGLMFVLFILLLPLIIFSLFIMGLILLIALEFFQLH